MLTLLVAITAFVYVRHRNQAASKSEKHPAKATKQKGDDSLAGDMRLAAYMFLVLSVVLGGALYYFSWQDDHSIMMVSLFREGRTEPVVYEVYRFQLADRSFVTIDGITVNVASSERMEVVEGDR